MGGLTIQELTDAAVRDGCGSIALSYIMRAYTLGMIVQIQEENAKLAKEIARLRAAANETPR